MCPAVCAVRQPASGWHPFAPAARSLSSTLTLPAFSSWVPMATPVSPYHSSLYPPPLPKLGRTCILPFPDSPIHQHKAQLHSFFFFLFTLYVCHCVCVCACVRLSLSTVGGHSKFRLIKTDYFRVPSSQADQKKIRRIISQIFSKEEQSSSVWSVRRRRASGFYRDLTNAASVLKD